MTTPIPRPPALPFLGHVTQIDSTDFSKSLNLLAQQYGDIYEISFFGGLSRSAGKGKSHICTQSTSRPTGDRRIVVNSYELANEVCDDKRFPKIVNGALDELRRGVGDALFTVSFLPVPALSRDFDDVSLV